MPTVAYKTNNRLTAEEIEVRVWAFVIIILVTILLGAMVAFLYSVTYVTQPMAGMAPIDKIYTQQISTIMVFITGVLGWCGWPLRYQGCSHCHLQVRSQRH
jgi:hypothetical protein